MTKDQIAQFKADVALNAEKLEAEQKELGVVDWTKTNAQLAAQLGTTKRQVSKMRKARV